MTWHKLEMWVDLDDTMEGAGAGDARWQQFDEELRMRMLDHPNVEKIDQTAVYHRDPATGELHG